MRLYGIITILYFWNLYVIIILILGKVKQKLYYKPYIRQYGGLL